MALWERDLLEALNVSRETFDKFKEYESLLGAWQKKINLVSRETIEQAWQRHLLDSAKIALYIQDKSSSLLDLGSGAGLPGVVLSILGFSNVKLVESNKKKTAFLKEVRRKLDLSYEVYEDRIEALKPFEVGVVTSRALASLDELLFYSYGFTTQETQLIFHKGKSNKVEIERARSKWHFQLESKPSITSQEGVVLILSELCEKR